MSYGLTIFENSIEYLLKYKHTVFWQWGVLLFVGTIPDQDLNPADIIKNE